ncbi:hypothetical protein ALC57_15644 [Trachymyrmex cornetzi]|uniref:Protein asteroid n=1 Tax=Trachymyrmex cornetzi TaxID=471704 RepID=A0A151IWN8_9HYME|nr:hypothetical protein ALC57_15644 [Trachymyrmex cornetzi]
MRKCVKSTLYKAFEQCSDSINFGNSIYVIDGGYLLHRVVWNHMESFASICNNYIEFVRIYYKSNAVIVFDGYPEDANKSTKCAERLRRSRKHSSADVLFNDSIIPTISQEKFLANDRNKKRLIEMLTTKFLNAGFEVEQAEEDADRLIVITAISKLSEFDSVIIIGEDIDLLVLLTALASNNQNIYLLKPGKGKIEQQIYSSTSLQVDKSVAENIAFVHAFSGCDSTSALFNQGKIKLLNILKQNTQLNEIVEIFREENADSHNISEAGERVLAALYGYSDDVRSLNDIRYYCFTRSVYKTKFNLASLPPTEDAARQHSFRTYYQESTAIVRIHKKSRKMGMEKEQHRINAIPH